MVKGSQYGTRSQKRLGVMPERMHVSRPLPRKGTPKGQLSYKQLESIFDSLPESILVCDRECKIIRINAQALQLFEVGSSAFWKGKSTQQFLQDYQPINLWQQQTSSQQWLIDLVSDDEVGSGAPRQTLMLHLPSGGMVYVTHRNISLFEAQMQESLTISIFHNITHRYQKALHLQRVREATDALTDAIAHLPLHIDLASSQDMLLLSPAVIFVAKQLVDLVRQVLSFRWVSLVGFGPPDHDYLVAGSGLTPEQEQYWQHVNGCVLCLDELIDETVITRLSTRQEVILQDGEIRRPLPFRSEGDSEKLLIVPLFLEQQWVGVLVTVKADANNSYTLEEVELVKAVVAQMLLIIEYLDHLHKQAEVQTRALLQGEIHHLCDDFLTLASHELLTPLTAIFGNIQLAQRRLRALKHSAIEQPEYVHQTLERVRHSLASASQSASLQKRMIYDLIDDAQIQTNQLKLHMRHCDLLDLLRQAVSQQQQLVPEYPIVLRICPTEQSVPILADAERITRVLDTYLTNALNHSPGKIPVTVMLVVADGQALVSVHDEGPGIPPEVQEHLWERFYRAKGSAVQHELDLSLGLGFYLCRALIEYHHGRVGVQSEPEKGETFWFTLPVADYGQLRNSNPRRATAGSPP